MASGSTPSSPTAVAPMTVAAPACTAPFDAMSGEPENEAADTNVSG
jgi:hypothetical protein